MTKYFSYYLRIFKLSVMNEMAHRGNFIVWLVIHTVSLLSLIFFFKIVYHQTAQINGWTEYQTLLVLGVGSLITGLGSLTFFPFMYNFGETIANGDFDFRLVKPLDVHFQSAFCWVDVEDFIVVPNSLLLIGYALWQLQPSNLLLNMVFFLILLLSSMILLFALLTLIQSLAFKLIRVDTISNFYWSIVNVGKYPAKAITGVGKFVAVLLAPIAIISSIPAEILFGRFDLPWILCSLLSAAFLFWFSRKLFQSSLRNYSSASS